MDARDRIRRFLAIRQQGLLIKFGRILGSRLHLIPDECVPRHACRYS